MIRYVLPDLDQRVDRGAISATALPIEVSAFKVFSMPNDTGDSSVVVQLNEEVDLQVIMKSTRPVAKGETLTLADIHPDECYIQSPTHDGKPLPYFLYLRQFLDHRIYFDFVANSSKVAGNFSGRFKLKFPVAEVANALQFFRTINVVSQLTALVGANWPPAPGYYPSVVQRLHTDPSAIGTHDFVEVVATAYGRNYWNRRIAFWRETDFYNDRQVYLETAIDRYFEGDFVSSTYVIVPQFEGIIKAYLQRCGRKPKSGFPECADQLKQIFLSRKIILFPRNMIDAIFGYLKDGDFWRSSRRIADPSSVVNRHGILHGAFTGFEGKRVALKYLILLDGLDYLLLHDKILSGNL